MSGMLSPGGIDEQAEFLAGCAWFRADVGCLDSAAFEAWLEATVDGWVGDAHDFDAIAAGSAIARRAWQLCRGR